MDSEGGSAKPHSAAATAATAAAGPTGGSQGVKPKESKAPPPSRLLPEKCKLCFKPPAPGKKLKLAEVGAARRPTGHWQHRVAMI